MRDKIKSLVRTGTKENFLLAEAIYPSCLSDNEFERLVEECIDEFWEEEIYKLSEGKVSLKIDRTKFNRIHANGIDVFFNQHSDFINLRPVHATSPKTTFHMQYKTLTTSHAFFLTEIESVITEMYTPKAIPKPYDYGL